MKLEDLKNRIETKRLNDSFLVLVYKTSSFLAEQYYHEISRFKNLTIMCSDDINAIIEDRKSPFYVHTDDLHIIRVDSLPSIPPQDYSFLDNVIVITQNADNIDSNYVVKLPELLPYQIKDYCYSLLEGCEERDIEDFFNLVGDNIERVNFEILKLLNFSDIKERKKALSRCLHEGEYSDICKSTIFDLSNAIVTKNRPVVGEILANLEKIDIEPIGLLTVLYNNFKNIISVQTMSRPTPENTGMSEKQIWVFQKHYIGRYSKEQLMDIMLLITDMNKKLMTNQLPVSEFINYLVINILS